MHSNTRSDQEAPPVGAAALGELLDTVNHAERLLAKAVLLAGRLAGSGVAERVEGLPLEQVLGLACRLTGADRRMLVAAGETLARLPATAALFADGQLSWGQVRGVVTAVRRLPAAARAVLDQRVAATVAAHGGVDGFDPDQLLWAVDAAADDLRDPREVHRRERRQAQASFVALQPTLDGRLRGYLDLDPVTGAPVLNALDAAAGRPAPDPTGAQPDRDDRDGDGGGDGQGRWSATTRSRQYAQALSRICAQWLGGGPGRPARPLLVAHVDLAQAATSTTAATVELALRGDLPRLSAAAVEQLTADADLRTVLFEHARPLAAAARTTAVTVPAGTRVAVAARDLGCRFPAAAEPLGHCDLHHLRHRARGGDHHPDNLAHLCRRHHTLAHRHHWQLTLDPASGQVTAARGRRRWRSLPRGTPLAPAPDPPRSDPPAPDPSLPADHDLPF